MCPKVVDVHARFCATDQGLQLALSKTTFQDGRYTTQNNPPHADVMGGENPQDKSSIAMIISQSLKQPNLSKHAQPVLLNDLVETSEKGRRLHLNLLDQLVVRDIPNVLAHKVIGDLDVGAIFSDRHLLQSIRSWHRDLDM